MTLYVLTSTVLLPQCFQNYLKRGKISCLSHYLNYHIISKIIFITHERSNFDVGEIRDTTNQSLYRTQIQTIRPTQIVLLLKGQPFQANR